MLHSELLYDFTIHSDSLAWRYRPPSLLRSSNYFTAAKHSNISVSVFLHISKTDMCKLHLILLPVWPAVFSLRQRDTLYTSGFADDVIFAHNGQRKYGVCSKWLTTEQHRDNSVWCLRLPCLIGKQGNDENVLVVTTIGPKTYWSRETIWPLPFN